MTTSDTPASAVQTILSISHDKDVDGLTAAAIVLRYAKSKGLKHDVMLTDYGSFEQVFSKVAKYRNALIVVTDLGMDDNVLDPIISGLTRAISQGSRLVWLDHHQWSERAVKAILALPNKPILKVNHEFCGAEIAYKVLMPRDGISGQLALIAHDTDFNLREIKAAGALTDALSVIRFAALDRREDLTSAIMPLLKGIAEGGIEGVWDEASERLKDELLWKRVENYRKERFKKMKRALAGHCDQIIHDRLVRIVEMPSGVTTTDIGTFLAEPENLEVDSQKLSVADLLVTISPGGMLGFRRGSDGVMCNAAASHFSGGGHPYAAGGEYGLYDNFQAVCDDIFLTLSKSMNWIEPTPS